MLEAIDVARQHVGVLLVRLVQPASHPSAKLNPNFNMADLAEILFGQMQAL